MNVPLSIGMVVSWRVFANICQQTTVPRVPTGCHITQDPLISQDLAGCPIRVASTWLHQSIVSRDQMTLNYQGWATPPCNTTM